MHVGRSKFLSCTFWGNPDLSGGESGLGEASETGSGADAFGSAFDTMYVSADGGGLVDALRISDDATSAFQFVTVGTIPEPTTMLLIVLGGIPLLSRRR